MYIKQLRLLNVNQFAERRKHANTPTNYAFAHDANYDQAA